MINKIFWDIDETLIHTHFNKSDYHTFSFTLKDSSGPYYTIVRPCARRLIEYSRSLVGKENVYILTTSTFEYASTVSEKANWQFEPYQILGREVIKDFHKTFSYVTRTFSEHPLRNSDNILIDNLPARENNVKVNLIGIQDDEVLKNKYLKIDDYYGTDYADTDFEKQVIDFLNKNL